MSCTYEIGLMANKKVAEKVDAFIESDEAKKNWGRWDRKVLQDGSTMYRTWQNNHPSWYPVGKKFLELIKSFEESKYEPDAFRCIMISEEGYKEEHSNTPGQLFFEDFDSPYEIQYPETFEASDDVDMVKQALIDCDCDASAEVIADAIAQADVSMSFEALATSYVEGDASFRKGMDNALFNLLGLNMAQIASKVSKEV